MYWLRLPHATQHVLQDEEGHEEGHRGYAATDQRYGEKTRYHAIRRASSYPCPIQKFSLCTIVKVIIRDINWYIFKTIAQVNKIRT